MITDFPSAPILNPAGLSTFIYVPWWHVRVLPEAINKVISAPIELYNDFRWFKGYATSDSLIFKENAASDASGTVYDLSLKGFVPGDSAALSDLMQGMEVNGLQHLVIFSDMLGKRRVAGYGVPLDFSASFDSSGRGYDFTFSASVLERAPVYPFPVVF